MSIYGKIALFVGGTLFGSAGFKLLASKDAKKVYSQVTAAALRCKDEVMRSVEQVQEGWSGFGSFPTGLCPESAGTTAS